MASIRNANFTSPQAFQLGLSSFETPETLSASQRGNFLEHFSYEGISDIDFDIISETSICMTLQILSGTSSPYSRCYRAIVESPTSITMQPRRRCYSLTLALFNRECSRTNISMPRTMLQSFTSNQNSTYEIGSTRSGNSPPFGLQFGLTKRAGTLVSIEIL